MGIGQRNVIIIIIIIKKKKKKKKNFFGNFSACFVDVFVIIPGLLSQLLFSTSLIYYAEKVSSRASGAQRNSVQSHMHQLQYIQRAFSFDQYATDYIRKFSPFHQVSCSGA
jgi:hypothetical protein